MAGLLSGLFNSKWTLSDLAKTDITRQQKSGSCSVSLENIYCELQKESLIEKFKRFFTRQKNQINIFYVIFKFSVSSDTGHSHKVTIRTQYDPDGVIYYGNIAQIYCDCADFKYHSAWNLGQHSSLFRSERTELELGPAITNAPKVNKSSVMCKHSYAAIMYLMNNYQNLMGNV